MAHVSHRHQHFPQLHVRPALSVYLTCSLLCSIISFLSLCVSVEDADDLMVVFTEYSHDVTQDYGKCVNASSIYLPNVNQLFAE